VQLQAAATATDSYGEEILTWPAAETDVNAQVVWADVEDLDGRELLLAQQASSEATVRVRMRYRDGVTTEHRIVHGGRTLHVVHVNNVEGQGRELELLCKEVT